MSLYGLDFILDKHGKPFLLEINGVRSGMSGFEQVYGDDRVQQQVWDMLKEKYGMITIDNGLYTELQFRKNHPHKAKISKFLNKFDWFRNWDLQDKEVLKSEKSRAFWLLEKAPNSSKLTTPFDPYVGQESTVFNSVNSNVPHPTINPPAAEEITYNKFFQYFLMQNTPFEDYLIPSALVGMGITNENALKDILSMHESFIIKPILGECGLGIAQLTKEEASGYRGTRGALDDPQLDSLFEIMNYVLDKPKTVKNLIDENKFIFEAGLSLIQPFIDTRIETENYWAIRSIVCNGEFVDMYARHNNRFKANLSQNAKAEAYRDTAMGKLSEEIVDEFETVCDSYEKNTHRAQIYNQYIEETGGLSVSKNHVEALCRLVP